MNRFHALATSAAALLALLGASPVVSAAAAAAAADSTAAKTTTIAYTWPDLSSADAYLVDWIGTRRAHIGDALGAANGNYVDDGTQRIVTLDAPQSYTITNIDCNGFAFDQRVDNTQYVFRQTSGTARKGTNAIVVIGTITDLGGCTPGLVTPFGSPGDPGQTYSNLNMTNRPGIGDLGVGARIAGPSDTLLADTNIFNLVQQTMTVNAGSVSFSGSHATDPAAIVDGWFEITLADGSLRRYTRLSKNASSGVEIWLGATWAGGQSGLTWQTLMTAPLAGAGFGTVFQASRHWESGLFFGSPTTLTYDLYRDGTGVRTSTDASGSFTSPVTWAFSGTDLVTTRVLSSQTRVRTWTPVANVGRNHFIFETEVANFNDGTHATLIQPRMNFYIDEGPAR